MTREQAWQVERQLRKRYPVGIVDVTRVFGGVEVTAVGESGYVFLRADDDSPLLALFGAAPDTRAPRLTSSRAVRRRSAARTGGNPCRPVAARCRQGFPSRLPL